MTPQTFHALGVVYLLIGVGMLIYCTYDRRARALMQADGTLKTIFVSFMLVFAWGIFAIIIMIENRRGKKFW